MYTFGDYTQQSKLCKLEYNVLRHCEHENIVKVGKHAHCRQENRRRNCMHMLPWLLFVATTSWG